MFKNLLLATILCVPCMALAGQAMSLDDGFAVASTASSQMETVISPMQDGGGATDAMHVPGAGRGTDASNAHVPADNPHQKGNRSAPGSDVISAHPHKAHGKAPWQSLLPGAMK